MKGKFGQVVLFIQITFIILFAFLVKYGPETDAKIANSTELYEGSLVNTYPMFQDVNAMIFIGVGMLYSYIRRYSYSGIGMSMLLAVIAIQWSIIIHDPVQNLQAEVQIDSYSLLAGEVAAASVVIALGGIFGKSSPLQMVIFTLIEVLFYTINEHICVSELKIADVGGTVSLHMFAGIFGCAAAWEFDRSRHVQDNSNEDTSYESNVFCLIGTVLLWSFWPSFNSAFLTGDQQYRCVLHTFLALLASCMTVFAVSSVLHPEKKFAPCHIQNATLAGGVAIGATGNLMIQPYGALLIGSIAGAISVLGFKYVTPFLARIKVYDPCGINSLHALPGLFGGLAGIAATAFASESYYGNRLYDIYPAMTPEQNVTRLDYSIENGPSIDRLGRTLTMQMCFQLLYVVEVAVAAIVTGILTGAIINLNVFEPVEEKSMFLDEPFWVVPNEEFKEKHSHESTSNKSMK